MLQGSLSFLFLYFLHNAADDDDAWYPSLNTSFVEYPDVDISDDEKGFLSCFVSQNNVILLGHGLFAWKATSGALQLCGCGFGLIYFHCHSKNMTRLIHMMTMA